MGSAIGVCFKSPGSRRQIGISGQRCTNQRASYEILKARVFDDEPPPLGDFRFAQKLQICLCFGGADVRKGSQPYICLSGPKLERLRNGGSHFSNLSTAAIATQALSSAKSRRSAQAT